MPQRYINVLFSSEMIKQIDEFRFTARIESRTEAIRKLIECALQTPKKAAKVK
jgi:metal-responsive CopG/Arc/MetJ family transcriptional regulator